MVVIVPSYETMETTPGDRMMSQLNRWVEVISGEFKTTECYTLRTLGTMGTNPGDRMMGHLEQREETISGEFNSQEVVKTMWKSRSM